MIPPASVPTDEIDAAVMRRAEDEYQPGFVETVDYDALDWRYEISGDDE